MQVRVRPGYRPYCRLWHGACGGVWTGGTTGADLLGALADATAGKSRCITPHRRQSLLGDPAHVRLCGATAASCGGRICR
jgi:hypothetical protein